MKKYIINIFIVLSERILMLSFQIWMVSIYIKTLGVNTFGVWSYTFNSISILLAITIFAIDVIVIKDIVKKPINESTYIINGIIIQILGLLIAIVISYLILDIKNEIVKLSLTSILIGNLFIVLSKPFYWKYSALVESKYRTISSIVNLVVFIPLIILFLNNNNNNYVLFIYAIFYTCQFATALLIYFFIYNGSLKYKLSINHIKRYFNIGLKLIISSLSVILFTQTDVIMINYFLGNQCTGEFSAATKVSMAIFMLAGIMANTFYPKIVNFNEVQSLTFLKVVISIVTLCSIIGSFIIFFLSPYITSILFGYNESITKILSLHIWCSLFIFSGAFTSRYLYANELFSIEIFKTVIAALSNVLINIILLPKIGVIGAVYSSIFSYFLANYFCLFLFKESRHLFFVTNKSILLLFNLKEFKREFIKLKCLFQ